MVITPLFASSLPKLFARPKIILDRTIFSLLVAALCRFHKCIKFQVPFLLRVCKKYGSPGEIFLSARARACVCHGVSIILLQVIIISLAGCKVRLLLLAQPPIFSSTLKVAISTRLHTH
jgi:hypothetical protein